MSEKSITIPGIDSDVWWQIKAIAASKKLSLKEYIETILKDTIEKENSK